MEYFLYVLFLLSHQILKAGYCYLVLVFFLNIYTIKIHVEDEEVLEPVIGRQASRMIIEDKRCIISLLSLVSH